MTYVDRATKRRIKAFASGLATGLAAPALLMSGVFDLSSARRISTMEQPWRDVGHFLKISAAEFRRRSDPGAAGNQPPENGAVQSETIVLEEVTGELVSQGLERVDAARVAKQVVTRVFQRIHMGPLPTVEDFGGYEGVCPGASRDILNMAMGAQKHAHRVELLELAGEIGLKILGIAAALAVVGGMLYAAVFCAVRGQTAIGVALASGTGIATIVGVFLRNFLRKADAPQPPSPAPQKPSPTKKKPKARR